MYLKLNIQWIRSVYTAQLLCLMFIDLFKIITWVLKSINIQTRNAQLRYSHIVYCTLWEECKQKQTQCPHSSYLCLRYPYILFPSPLIIDVLSLNSLFWSPPTAVHRFDASDMAVPGLYISWLKSSSYFRVFWFLLYRGFLFGKITPHPHRYRA